MTSIILSTFHLPNGENITFSLFWDRFQYLPLILWGLFWFLVRLLLLLFMLHCPYGARKTKENEYPMHLISKLQYVSPMNININGQSHSIPCLGYFHYVSVSLILLSSNICMQMWIPLPKSSPFQEMYQTFR